MHCNKWLCCQLPWVMHITPHPHQTTPIFAFLGVFLVQDVIYTLALMLRCQCPSVCLWRKCIVVAVHAGKRGGVISRYAIATARPCCYMFVEISTLVYRLIVAIFPTHWWQTVLERRVVMATWPIKIFRPPWNISGMAKAIETSNFVLEWLKLETLNFAMMYAWFSLSLDLDYKLS